MGIQYSFRRYEKKYVLSPRQQEQLLQRIAPYMRMSSAAIPYATSIMTRRTGG